MTQFIYCLQTQQFYLVNPTLHAACFGRSRASSGIKMRNLKRKWTCVKHFLRCVRLHRFYKCHNIGLLWIFLIP